MRLRQQGRASEDAVDAVAWRAALAAKEIADATEHEQILAADPDAPIGGFYRDYGLHVLELRLEQLEGRHPNTAQPAEQN